MQTNNYYKELSLKIKKKKSYPENLVALLQALFSSWAIFQDSSYKNAHVIASSQPQPNTLPLPELHQLHAWPAERQVEQLHDCPLFLKKKKPHQWMIFLSFPKSEVD